MGNRALVVWVAPFIGCSQLQTKVLKWPKLILSTILLCVTVFMRGTSVGIKILDFYKSKIYAHIVRAVLGNTLPTCITWSTIIQVLPERTGCTTISLSSFFLQDRVLKVFFCLSPIRILVTLIYPSVLSTMKIEFAYELFSFKIKSFFLIPVTVMLFKLSCWLLLIMRKTKIANYRSACVLGRTIHDRTSYWNCVNHLVYYS